MPEEKYFYIIECPSCKSKRELYAKTSEDALSISCERRGRSGRMRIHYADDEVTVRHNREKHRINHGMILIDGGWHEIIGQRQPNQSDCFYIKKYVRKRED